MNILGFRIYMIPDGEAQGGGGEATPPPLDFEDYAVGGQVVKVPKGTAKIIGSAFSAERNKLKKELDSIQASLLDKDKSLEEKQKALQEYEEKFTSAEERFKKQSAAEIEKTKTELKNVTSEKDKLFNMFKSKTIDAEISNALASFKTQDGRPAVYNIKQAATLLKNSDIKIIFEANKDGEYETKFELTKDGIPTIVSAKDAVQDFLSREESLNLLVSDARSGGSTPYGGAGKVGQSGRPEYKNSEYARNEEVRKKYEADYRNGLNPILVD
jgi:hypothetical protein